jgi:hypothetical protein
MKRAYRKEQFLSPFWRYRIQDYLLLRLGVHLPRDENSSGDFNLGPYFTTNAGGRWTYSRREAMINEVYHLGQVTFNAKDLIPEWPFGLYHLPSKRQVRLFRNTEVSYDEYLRMICKLMECRVKIVDNLPYSVGLFQMGIPDGIPFSHSARQGVPQARLLAEVASDENRPDRDSV